LNDLECPIRLKVRLVDGTLDVRLLRVSDSTTRIDVTSGEEGEWAGRPSPPFMWAADALFFCGIAELLVSLACVKKIKKIQKYIDGAVKLQRKKSQRRCVLAVMH